MTELKNLPAGNYTVNCGIPSYAINAPYEWRNGNDAYAFKNESVTIKYTGDKQYPEWEYVKKDGGRKVNVKVDFDYDKANVSAQHMNYVIVFEDEEGNREAFNFYGSDSSNPGYQTVAVTSGKKYKVSLYTMKGYQVAETSVNVQTIDTSCKISLNAADQD